MITVIGICAFIFGALSGAVVVCIVQAKNVSEWRRAKSEYKEKYEALLRKSV